MNVRPIAAALCCVFCLALCLCSCVPSKPAAAPAAETTEDTAEESAAPVSETGAPSAVPAEETAADAQDGPMELVSVPAERAQYAEQRSFDSAFAPFETDAAPAADDPFALLYSDPRYSEEMFLGQMSEEGRYGIALLHVDSAMNASYYNLYRTRDGGKSWEQQVFSTVGSVQEIVIRGERVALVLTNGVGAPETCIYSENLLDTAVCSAPFFLPIEPDRYSYITAARLSETGGAVELDFVCTPEDTRRVDLDAEGLAAHGHCYTAVLDGSLNVLSAGPARRTAA